MKDPELRIYVVFGADEEADDRLNVWFVAANFSEDEAVIHKEKCQKQLEFYEDMKNPADPYVPPGITRSRVQYRVNSVAIQQTKDCFNHLMVWMDSALEVMDKGNVVAAEPPKISAEERDELDRAIERAVIGPLSQMLRKLK